jgi:hypothetical protein
MRAAMQLYKGVPHPLPYAKQQRKQSRQTTSSCNSSTNLLVTNLLITNPNGLRYAGKLAASD